MKELSLINCRLDRRYDIHEQLGRGSYAEIYLAHDTLASTQSAHRTVVIKALNVFLQDDLDADLERTLVENFQNEAIALDRVRHPNVISRIGHGTARDLKGTVFHYLVLEYMPGGDLQALVRKRRCDLKTSLGYIEQICAGLGHAHQKGVIHRDIKPQNLLLTEDHATVKIADFGVARLDLSDSPITRVGTNIYAPPEHSPINAGKGIAASLTPAADIYSLAKSVYTVVTGESPRAFSNDRITSLPDECAKAAWADALLNALRRSTESDPASRPQSVEEFWDELLPVREIAAEAEPSTILHLEREAPQAHVSRGYSPVAPAKPDFEIIPTKNTARTAFVPPAHKFPIVVADPATMPAATPASTPAAARVPAARTPRKRKTLRRMLTFAVLLLAFTGILYGTANYIRGKNVLGGIQDVFKPAQTGTANTDIYLRPSPNTDSDPIGLVTKNSKVRIVGSKDNWYQVDIVEQGRPRPQAASATRGWLNGKYLDLSEN